MSVVLTVPGGAWVRWRHFNHSDNPSVTSTLLMVDPDPGVLVPISERWPGNVGTLFPRGGDWAATLRLRRTTSQQEALHLLDVYDPGPPANHEGQYQDPGELAGMIYRAWRIRWEAPWQGGGSADYNDVYTYLWVYSVRPEGHGWTVGHLGVFPSAPEDPL